MNWIKAFTSYSTWIFDAHKTHGSTPTSLWYQIRCYSIFNKKKLKTKFQKELKKKRIRKFLQNIILHTVMIRCHHDIKEKTLLASLFVLIPALNTSFYPLSKNFSQFTIKREKSKCKVPHLLLCPLWKKLKLMTEWPILISLAILLPVTLQ